MSITNQQLVKILEFSIQEHQKVMEAHSVKMNDLTEKLNSFEMPNNLDLNTFHPILTELKSILQKHSNELYKSEKRLERKLRFPKLSIYALVTGLLLIFISIAFFSIQNSRSKIEKLYEKRMSEMTKGFTTYFEQNPDEFEKFLQWINVQEIQENKVKTD